LKFHFFFFSFLQLPASHSSQSLLVALLNHFVTPRRFYYQYDYLPLLAMLLVYLPTSAYSNGIACSTGIVIPCLLNGALIGRIFGLLMTDLMGAPGNDPAWAWVDPGAFALLGAAGEEGDISFIREISNQRRRRERGLNIKHLFIYAVFSPQRFGVSNFFSRPLFLLLLCQGFFAGVARITMALTVIITELTNDTHFILPIMVAIMVRIYTRD
jgi:H+/Cl- antiporter ClcA